MRPDSDRGSLPYQGSALTICATHGKQGQKDSNFYRRFWRPPCCHCTMPPQRRDGDSNPDAASASTCLAGRPVTSYCITAKEKGCRGKTTTAVLHNICLRYPPFHPRSSKSGCTTNRPALNADLAVTLAPSGIGKNRVFHSCSLFSYNIISAFVRKINIF